MTDLATVLVADDHAVMADALAVSLARWYNVVGTVISLDLLPHEIDRLKPNVVTLDVEFGKASSLTILRSLVERFPDTKFVILTAFLENVFAEAAMRDGASAFVVKESAPAELRIAIEEALAGRTYLTPLMQARGATVTPVLTHITLSDRQRAVLGYLRQGWTHQAIATRLTLSVKTVEYHIDVVKKRTGVIGRTQLIRWAEKYFEDDKKT